LPRARPNAKWIVAERKAHFVRRISCFLGAGFAFGSAPFLHYAPPCVAADFAAIGVVEHPPRRTGAAVFVAGAHAS